MQARAARNQATSLEPKWQRKQRETKIVVRNAREMHRSRARNVGIVSKCCLKCWPASKCCLKCWPDVTMKC
eukprot:562261-Pyramimonas_sp.AAC.1